MKIVLDIQDNKADEILSWLKQFNFVKISLGKSVKSKIKANASIEANLSPNDMQKMLLKGPIMSDAQYQDYLEKRKHLRSWK